MSIEPSLRQMGRLSRQFLIPTVFVFIALCLTLTSMAQSTQSYAGRPFIRIAQPNLSDPVAGFYFAFGRSQLVGNSVFFVTLNGPSVGGLYSGRGAVITKIASPGSTLSGVTVQSFHDGFARDTGSGSVAIAAGVTRPDTIFLTDGTPSSILLAAGAILPNSGGKVANSIGEPYYANGNVAVIAAHVLENGGGTSFQGVYRVKAGALEVVADIATDLPGDFGVPDGFSSQVGFDGEVLAFWASRGSFSATNGMFMQNAAGTVTKILQTGETFPGGGTVNGVLSPPVVSAGVVYFFAYDTNAKTSLLKYENGTLSVLARDDDATPEGGQIWNLGQSGMGVAGGKVFFAALTAAGAGVYVIENGSLSTVVRPGMNLGGFLPSSITLQDVSGDTLVLDAANFSVRRLVANLAQPSLPIITTDLTNQTAAANARVEFKVTVLGEEPLTYIWNFAGTNLPAASGNTLVVENADVSDIGYYRVTVTNAFGQASSVSAFLNVEVPPVIFGDLTNTTVEVGDQLSLRVNAIGGMPLSYIWQKNGEVVTSDSPAVGFFIRTATQTADAGTYSVIVSNAFGTVTSAEAVVTVTPSAPNPSYAGVQFHSYLDSNSVDPYSETMFDTSVLSEMSARWVGDSSIVYVGQNTLGQPLGLFAWSQDTYGPVISPGHPLGNGLGNADAFSLIAALPSEPLTLRGQQLIGGFLQPVGFYQIGMTNLAVIADTNTVAPESTGAKFPLFYYDAYQAGGKTVFASLVDNTNAIYRAENGTLTRVLHAKQDLPVVGTATTQFQGLTQNGTDIVVTAATSGQQNMVMLKIGANGEITKLLAKDEALPGTAGTVRSMGAAGTDGEAFYQLVYDATFAAHILKWKDGVFTRLAGPGMAVEGMGAILSLETSFPKGAAGKTYFSARVTTPQGNKQGILVADEDGIRPVLFATKLDAKRVGAVYVMDVRDERLIVLVQFATAGRAIYANYAHTGPNLEIQFTRPNASTLLFNVPQGAVLEAATTLDGEWVPVENPEVPITGASRFFRMRGE